MTVITWTAKQVWFRTAFTWSLALLSIDAHAATYRVPGEFETLGAVFAQIASGDTILVAPGTYAGPGNRDILVRKTDFVLISEKGPAETVLDLDRSRGTYLLQLELQTRETLIEGFTFRRSEGASALVIRSSGPVIRNCIFRDNRGGNSGGLLTQGTSPALIESCLFENNTGTWGGGAGCNGTAQAEFVSCRFFENEAIEGGGLGFFGAWGDATVRIEHCIFGRNTADRGGAISISLNSSHLELVVEGCTVSENSANDEGGGLWCSGAGQDTILIERTILSGNASPRGPDLHTRCDPPVIGCSAVHPDSIFGDVVYGDDNVSQDPLLCLAGDLENRYRLEEGSPCLPEFSPCGERIGALGVGCVDGVGGACCLGDGTCEITTVEKCAGTYQGDSTPCDPGSCREGGACCADGVCRIVTREHCAQLDGVFLGIFVGCPPTACPTVACCLDGGACELLDPEACVAAGGSCFHPDVGCDPNPCGPRILRVPSEHPTIASALESACRGDTVLLAPGTYTGPGNRDLRIDAPGLTLKSEEGAESTILDCRGVGRALVIGGGTDSNVRIEGITIRDGRAIESNGAIGGGILFETGTHSLVDCRVEGCSAPTSNGGGIACLDTEVSIIGCAIVENFADKEFGAAYGGGVYAHQSVVTIESSVMAGNECGRGSGVYVERGELTIRNSSITGNWAGRGGGIAIDRSTAVIEGCTIAGNHGRDIGGGVFAYKSQGVEIRRTILWGNRSRRASEAFFSDSDAQNRVSLSVLHVPRIEADTLVLEEDAYFQDPLFCAPVSPLEAPTTAGDYSVADNSICVSTNNPGGERIGALEPGCSPLAIGACCSGKNAICILASPTECADFGWIFWGEDVPCDPVPCDEPGACCFHDGSCSLLVEELCLAREGRHHGKGTPCSPDLCPAPQPCCIPDRNCTPLPPVICEESGGRVLEPGPCSPWTCTPNYGGRLLVHAIAFSDSVPVRCAEIRNSVPGNGVHTVIILAAFPPENSPRLRRVAFGIDYPSDAVQILSWDVVSGTATPSESWPAPGSEIVIEWEEARRNSFEPLVSFEISVSAPADLRTTKSSQEPAGFVDDFDPPNKEEIACFGSLGIGVPGNQCCWSVGACCVGKDWECFETTQNHCQTFEGYYEGDHTECGCDSPAVLLGGVTVRERDFQVELTWEASSDVGIREFRVLRGDHPEESASVLAGLPEGSDGSWRYLDTTPAPGHSYSYWIESTEIDGSVERFGPWEIEIPEASEPRLLRIRPNPTTGAAEIDLFLPADLECSLTICDASGRAVRILDLERKQAGHNTELWDGMDAQGRLVRAGIYFLRLHAGRWRLGGKVVIME